MAVFVCLLLLHQVEISSPEKEREHRLKILHTCLPNVSDTVNVVWRRWTEKVVQQLLHIDDESESLPYLEEDEEDRRLAESERILLKQLLTDAGSAFRAYFSVCENLPDDSTHPRGN